MGTYVQIAKQTEAMMFPQMSGGLRPIRSRNMTHTTCPRSPMTLLMELMRRASFSKPTDWYICLLCQLHSPKIEVEEEGCET